MFMWRSTTSLPDTKKALMQNAGILCDPLSAGQAFMSRHQLTGETVRDYARHLSKLFKESYPEEAQTSAILLQKFLTGLSPPKGEALIFSKRYH